MMTKMVSNALALLGTSMETYKFVLSLLKENGTLQCYGKDHQMVLCWEQKNDDR